MFPRLRWLEIGLAVMKTATSEATAALYRGGEMRHARALWFSVTLVLVTAAATTFVAVASARQIDSGPIDDLVMEEFEDFCEVDGLTVEAVTHVVGRFHVVSHGPDQLLYFGANLKVTQVLTNGDNTVTSRSTFIDKDVRVTDNGDGTLTILILSTGNAVLYGPDGKAIARNPGQVRIELVVDHGGTPTDPEDDEEISFEIVKESTGRSDDFCAAAVPLLTA